MPYQISKADPSAMTTDQMNEEIAGFTKLAEEVVVRLSALLAEYRKRRVSHPFFMHPVLRFFQSVTDMTLHPRAAILLANKEMITAVLPLTQERQIEIAEGADVTVATMADTGEFEVSDKPIQRMDKPTMKRAFGPEGIRTVAAQIKIMRIEGKAETVNGVTVVRDQMALRIGNHTVRLEDLRGPLLALGFSLVLSRDVPAKAE